jgi:hypothetical protein
MIGVSWKEIGANIVTHLEREGNAWQFMVASQSAGPEEKSTFVLFL